MTINSVWLAITARVSPARFRDKLFADVLAHSQADIMKEVRSSKIDPYVQGRVFAFSDLLPIWQRPFLTKVGIRFKQFAAGLARETPKAPYLQLVELLRWIGESENPQCRAVLAEANAKGRITSAGDWEDVLFAYRSQLLSVSATGGMADSVISALRIALDGLSSGRIVPTTAMPIPGVKHVRRRRSDLRSFAEPGVTNVSDIEHDYVAFARERFLNAAKGMGLDMGTSESDEFISGLALELKQTDDLSADPVVAIRQVLDSRLDTLRSAAVSIVEEAIKTDQKGRELLSQAKIDRELAGNAASI